MTRLRLLTGFDLAAKSGGLVVSERDWNKGRRYFLDGDGDVWEILHADVRRDVYTCQRVSRLRVWWWRLRLALQGFRGR